ncbi:PREDICTED: PHAVU_010G142400g [Prunus dulcis]|uniref:PREDICTED: PHAVU_010G142400g n=1 Tax=Prunus dulcis TaxID=3755 RepID=A0A5E4F872_PRUDU|nr:uncharacterized protein LOC117623145 [Prunus dulcis]VVA24273.1 PREDICTED: PHAVU_010G142400g [Prunus dulcis]
MSVKKSLSLNNGGAGMGGASTKKTKKSYSLNNGGNGGDVVTAKRRRFDRCFSFMEISTEQGKSLKDMDSEKLKSGIRRWAKAVVAYARQVSGRFGGTRG